jgi:nucleoside-diphosphate-sugar epimerase
MAVNYYQKLPIVITRPFNYTGVGHDLRFVIPKIVDHFKRGRTYIELGNIEVFREFNDVRVVRQIYIKLLEKGVSGQTYNLCSGRKISLRNVITTLEKIAGYKIEVKVNTKFARENEVDVLLGSPKKMEQILGIISYRELEDTLSWMLND